MTAPNKALNKAPNKVNAAFTLFLNGNTKPFG
jgi:hypothetical protein